VTRIKKATLTYGGKRLLEDLESFREYIEEIDNYEDYMQEIFLDQVDDLIDAARRGYYGDNTIVKV
jgi:hypothetical protein